MHRFNPLIVFLLLGPWLAAQSFEFKGKFEDENGKPLSKIPYLFISNDLDFRTRGESDSLGQILISNLHRGSYQFKVRYIGYEPLNESISIDSNLNQLKLFYLITKREHLKEVTVKDKKAIGKVINDTLQFDASSFKMMNDASADQLMDKIPTITKDNGSIKAQGDDVKQVLIDGKPFFGNDPNLSLKNLPADLIDKVQIFDQLSEQSQFSGINDGNTVKTINIVTKNGLNNGQFGKAYAGYGISDKYQVGANYNLFDGNRRISLIGMSNNINIQNFSIDDILSVMGTSGNSRNRGGGGGNQSRFPSGRDNRSGNSGGPGDFLVPQTGGITQSHAFGINYSENINSKLELNLSYFYNKSNNKISNLLSREYLEDGLINQQYQEKGQSNPVNQNHRINARIEYKIDSFNSIVIRPRLSFQDNQSTSSVFSNTSIRDTTVNATNALQKTNNTGYNFNNSVLFRHRFAKPRRTYSLEFGQSIAPKDENSLLNTITEYHNKNRDFIDTIFQDARNQTDKWGINSSLEYNEPLTLLQSISINYRYNFQQEENNLITYDIPALDGLPKLINNKLSNHFISNSITHTPGLAYQFNKDQKLNINFRLNYQISQINNEQSIPVASTRSNFYYNILPSGSIRYTINRNKNFNFNYRSNTQLPNVSQLQNVINNTNPIHLSTGNPNLNQTITNQLSLRYSSTNKNASVFFIVVSGSLTKDYITNHLYIRSRNHPIFNIINLPIGSQLSIPENGGNSYQARSFVTYSLPIPYIKCNISVDGSFQYFRTPGWVDSLKYFSNQNTLSTGIGISSNVGPKLDFGINFRPSFNSYSSQSTNDNYYYFESKVRLAWQFYKDFVFRGDYNSKSNQTITFDKNEYVHLLNLALGMKVFKNKRGEVALGINDLFNQNENIQQIVTDSYIEDSNSNSVKRFLLLSFTYNIKNYNSGKAPINRSLQEKEGDRDRQGRWEERRF